MGSARSMTRRLGRHESRLGLRFELELRLRLDPFLSLLSLRLGDVVPHGVEHPECERQTKSEDPTEVPHERHPLVSQYAPP